MSQKKIPKALRTVISDYIHILKADHLPIQQVFLFGSYAKGNPHPWSDVDLCIISPKFSDYIDAIQYLLSMRKLNPQYPIEPIGMHPKDFRKNTTLSSEIKKTGIKIF
jgi:predicted nucleotidyltransferase